MFSAFVALTEKAIPFTLRDHSIPGGLDETFRDASLTATVPAIEEDGWWLAESLAIAEWAAETHPFPKHPRIFPEDLRERARCRQVMLWLRTELSALREARRTTSIFHADRRMRAPLAGDAAAGAADLIRVASALVKPGATTLFASWCIADADLGLALQRLHANGDPLPPALARYAEAQWERASTRAWLALRR